MSGIDLGCEFCQGDSPVCLECGRGMDLPKKRNKYMREILPGVWIDVYDVIEAFQVNDGGMQHALKKILACGQRGHKDEATDRKDILASIKRSNEIFNRRPEENE